MSGQEGPLCQCPSATGGAQAVLHWPLHPKDHRAARGGARGPDRSKRVVMGRGAFPASGVQTPSSLGVSEPCCPCDLTAPTPISGGAPSIYQAPRARRGSDSALPFSPLKTPKNP